MCEMHRPDVAILDIAMPRLNGIDVAEPRSSITPVEGRVPQHVCRRIICAGALSAGARGYLLKESAEQDLVPALRTISQGRRF